MRAALLLVAALLLAGCASDPPSADGNDSTPTPGRATPSAPPASVTPTGAATPAPTLAPGNATAEDAGSVEPMAPGTYKARVETSLGVIVIDLHEDKAPLHVANFLQYAEEGLYDGTVFHRVVKGFVIQGGGFSTPFNGEASKRPTEWGPIPTEIWSGNQHIVGSLGMARTNDANSATSQWFINTVRNTALDAGYTVFGQVVEGLDVAFAISNVTVGTKAGHQSVPVEDVVIHKVTIESPDAPPRPNLVSYTPNVGLAAGGVTSIPVLVKNVGGGRLEATFAASATAGATARLLRDPGAQSAGHAGVAIVEISAPASFTAGDLVFEATDGNGTDAIRVTLRKIDATGNAAGPEHPAVSTYYTGVYDNGVVFDTTRTDLEERGFTLPSGFREHPAPLKVYVGEGSGTSEYVPVIPGFASGIVGLRGGETRTVRLTSEEGYQDGYFRVFQMDVASVDS